MAADLTLENTTVGLSALVNDMSISLAIEKVKLDKVVVNSATFGHLSGAAIKIELNSALAIVVPIINHFLSNATIVIPSNLFGMVELR